MPSAKTCCVKYAINRIIDKPIALIYSLYIIHMSVYVLPLQQKTVLLEGLLCGWVSMTGRLLGSKMGEKI